MAKRCLRTLQRRGRTLKVVTSTRDQCDNGLHMKGEEAGEDSAGTPDVRLRKGGLGSCWQEKQKGAGKELIWATLKVRVHTLSKGTDGWASSVRMC